MITANQWYNIAKTSTAGSRTGIRLEMGSYYALLMLTVDYGSAVITAVESNISPDTFKLAARIRFLSGAWYADVRLSQGQDTDLSAALYDNKGWSSVTVNTSTAGSTICIINDVISQIRPSTGGGESLWERVNVGTSDEPVWGLIPKEYNGQQPGIITHNFITFGGMGTGSNTGSSSGANTLDTLNDTFFTLPLQDGQVLIYDHAIGKWVNGTIQTGLDETALGDYLSRNEYATESYVNSALEPFSDILDWFELDQDNNAIRLKEDYNFIVPGAISFGGVGTSSGSGGGLTQVTVKLGDVAYTSVSGVVSLPAYPVVPTNVSSLNNDSGYITSAALNEYATLSHVDARIAALVNSAPETLDTLGEIAAQIQDNIGVLDVLTQSITINTGNIASLQNLFTDGAANNALKLGGQLPEYYATADAFSTHVSGYNTFKKSTEDRLTALEALWYQDDENGAVRTDLNVIVKGAISFGGVGTSSGSGGGLTQVTVKLGDVAYTSVSGVVSLPAYPTSLANPYALTINNSAGAAQVAYNGSVAKTLTLSKAMVGLGNVENTALSTWAGSSKITTLGTITTGTWNGTKIANAYLANSAITINGTSTSLGGSFSTASITAGTAGTSSATSGYTLSVPYVTMNKYGIVTGYGTHTHTINSIPNSSLANSSVTISGTAVSLGGSITQAALRTALGLGSNAYTSTAYLPLSGGTIIGDYGALSIKRNNAYASLLKFENTGGNLGYLGFNSANIPVAYTSDAATMYTLIHSGNIGDYAIKTDGSNAMAVNSYLKWATTEGSEDYSAYANGFRVLNYNATTGNYRGGIHAGTRYGWQLVREGSTSTMQVRFNTAGTSTWLDWKTIAFTDSNVASATKLQTARTIWGQSFDGTGNVDGNVNIEGSITMSKGIVSGGTTSGAYLGPAAGGLGSGYTGALVYAYGANPIYFYTNATSRMIINSSGNVLIGTTTDSGGKLQVNGSVRVTGEWFYNTTAGTGLYNSAGDARWYYYSDFGGWHADKSIQTTLRYFACSGYTGSSWGNGAGALNVNITDNTAQTPLIVAFRKGSSPATAGSTRLFAMELLNSSTVMRWYFGSTIAYQFTSGGNFIASGSITFGSASDRRLKENITSITKDRTRHVLRSLRPVTFEWNRTAMELDSTRTGLCDGFIADEYERIIPNSGRPIWDKYRAIDYTRVIPYLTMGWQIHESEIEKLRRKVRKMEGRIAVLERILQEHNIDIAA